ncbi:MAG: hypothetical protein HFE76_03020 [Firmicutes bacterium]|nr:hypothetical protein [Bacillota bacterium]
MSFLKKKRSLLLVLLMMALLLGTAAIPNFFTAWQSRGSFDKTTLFTVGTGDLEDQTLSEDLWERLKILRGNVLTQTQGKDGSRASIAQDWISGKDYQIVSYSDGAGMAEVVSAEKLSERMKRRLAKRAEKQLKKLQSFGVFPAVSFAGRKDISAEKQIYMDMDNPDRSFSVWEIHMDYPDFFVCVFMDTETSALCEVSLARDAGPALYQKGKEQQLKDGFLKYLNTFSRVPGEHAGRAERFHVEGLFSQDRVCLYPASTDRQGKHTVSYQFF